MNIVNCIRSTRKANFYKLFVTVNFCAIENLCNKIGKYLRKNTWEPKEPQDNSQLLFYCFFLSVVFALKTLGHSRPICSHLQNFNTSHAARKGSTYAKEEMKMWVTGHKANWRPCVFRILDCFMKLLFLKILALNYQQ